MEEIEGRHPTMYRRLGRQHTLVDNICAFGEVQGPDSKFDKARERASAGERCADLYRSHRRARGLLYCKAPLSVAADCHYWGSRAGPRSRRNLLLIA